MTRADEELAALADTLAAKGDDGLRLEMVQRARRFKRSWVEMAEAIVQVRDTQAYRRWGYPDLYRYCLDELQIKGVTVDKLTGSFTALTRHAPQVLRRDGVAQSIPSVDCVDYFAQALGIGAANDGPRKRRGDGARVEPTEEVVEELRHAVFDEGRSVAELRRQFNPVLRPKPAGDDRRETIAKAATAAKRLETLLPDIDGLSAGRVTEVTRALEALRQDLDALRADSEAEAKAAQATG